MLFVAATVAVTGASASCSFGIYDGNGGSDAAMIGGVEQLLSSEGNFSLHVPIGAATPAVSVTITPLPFDPSTGTIGRRYQITPPVHLVHPASVAITLPQNGTPTNNPSGSSSPAVMVAGAASPSGPFVPLTIGGLDQSGSGAGSNGGPTPYTYGLTMDLAVFGLVEVTTTPTGIPDCAKTCCQTTNQVTIQRSGNACYCTTPSGGPGDDFRCMERSCGDLTALAVLCGGGVACGTTRCKQGEVCCYAGGAHCAAESDCTGAISTCEGSFDCDGTKGEQCCVEGTKTACSSSCGSAPQLCSNANGNAGCPCYTDNRCPFGICTNNGSLPQPGMIPDSLKPFCTL